LRREQQNAQKNDLTEQAEFLLRSASVATASRPLLSWNIRSAGLAGRYVADSSNLPSAICYCQALATLWKWAIWR
jgi:hypothetical protein